MTRAAAWLCGLLATGCYSTVDGGRPPAHVDVARAPDDIRRRVVPTTPTPGETRREVVLVQNPRIGGRKVIDASTTWAFGGDVSGWYGGTSMAGMRASATYVRDHGVTDASVGPAIGFPLLGNVGVAWAMDPIKRAHGAQAIFELGGMYFRYARYPGLSESRIEFGIDLALGIQSFSWYR